MREPIYIQISNDIREKIKSGHFIYGQQLPSERTLAQSYQIDRKTLRKALALLAEENLLVGIHGKGTYIAQQQIPYKVELMDDLAQTLTRSGMTPSTKVLFSESRPARRKYADLLHIAPEEEIFRLVRLRAGDNEPVALQDTYIVKRMIPNLEKLDFEMYSLYGIMKENGIEISRIDETFTFIELSDPEAGILNLKEGAIGFVSEDITYDQHGQIIEYTHSILNNQKLSVNANLHTSVK